ncbi:dTMP kinase [Chlamydia sp. 17-3921]|uniref:dTMP kinase n=1 Tax=Chlamydia sp. 17-3921 TaxID=2675798 RepID=UPI0019181EA9|nr:dTMP kinase [Chlamydia sp. 17-3921]
MFIVLEGGEGAGKSSLAKALQQRLIANNHSVVMTREPGGCPLGEQIRNIILQKSETEVSRYAELFLFLATRAQHIQETIIPALKKGHIVLCERFHDSTIVYQGITEGLGTDFVSNLCNHVIGDEPFLPDLVVLLDVPAEVGLHRKIQQKTLDKFEEKPLSYHQTIREGFLSLAQTHPDRYLILDAQQTLENSIEQILHFIR